jgi:hypothetical protein
MDAEQERQQAQPQQEKFDPKKLPPELQPIYQSMLRDYRSKTESLSKKEKEYQARLAELEEKVKQYDSALRGYERWVLSNQEGNLSSAQVNGPAEAGATSGPTATSAAPAYDPYDPESVRRYLDWALSQRDQAWTQYANQLNEYWRSQLLQAMAYSIWASAIAARDPQRAADPKFLGTLLQSAPAYGGDLDKAYEALRKPLEEKAALEAQIANLQKQIEEAQKKMPPVQGATPPSGMPVKPPETVTPKPMGSTGNYRAALANVPLDKLYKAEE